MKIKEELSIYLSNKFQTEVVPLRGTFSNNSYVFSFGKHGNKVLKLDLNRKRDSIDIYHFLKENPQLPVAKVYSYGRIVLPKKIVGGRIDMKHNKTSFTYCIMERVDVEIALDIEHLIDYLGDLVIPEGVYYYALHSFSIDILGNTDRYKSIMNQLKRFNDDDMYKLALEISDVIKELYDSGIKWVDIHQGQFGRNKSGSLVAFDLDNLEKKVHPKIKTFIRESNKYNSMMNFSNFSEKYRGSAKKFFKGLKHEIEENGELRRIIYDYLKDKKSLSKEDLEFVKKQTTDVLRMVGLLGIFVLPGASLILPALILGAKKVGIELIPEGFRLKESMGSNEIVDIIQDGKKIFVKYINGYSQHNIDKSYDPIDISGDEITLDINGDYYTTKLDWVIGIDENMSHYEVEPHMSEPLKDPTTSKSHLWKDDEDFIQLLKDQGGIKGVIRKMKKKYAVDYSDCEGKEDLYKMLKYDGFI